MRPLLLITALLLHGCAAAGSDDSSDTSPEPSPLSLAEQLIGVYERTRHSGEDVPETFTYNVADDGSYTYEVITARLEFWSIDVAPWPRDGQEITAWDWTGWVDGSIQVHNASAHCGADGSVIDSEEGNGRKEPLIWVDHGDGQSVVEVLDEHSDGLHYIQEYWYCVVHAPSPSERVQRIRCNQRQDTSATYQRVDSFELPDCKAAWERIQAAEDDDADD